MKPGGYAWPRNLEVHQIGRRFIISAEEDIDEKLILNDIYGLIKAEYPHLTDLPLTLPSDLLLETTPIRKSEGFISTEERQSESIPPETSSSAIPSSEEFKIPSRRNNEYLPNGGQQTGMRRRRHVEESKDEEMPKQEVTRESYEESPPDDSNDDSHTDSESASTSEGSPSDVDSRTETVPTEIGGSEQMEMSTRRTRSGRMEQGTRSEGTPSTTLKRSQMSCVFDPEKHSIDFVFKSYMGSFRKLGLMNNDEIVAVRKKRQVTATFDPMEEQMTLPPGFQPLIPGIKNSPPQNPVPVEPLNSSNSDMETEVRVKEVDRGVDPTNSARRLSEWLAEKVSVYVEFYASNSGHHPPSLIVQRMIACRRKIGAFDAEEWSLDEFEG